MQMTESLNNYGKVLYELNISPESAAGARELLEKVPQVSEVLSSPVVSLAAKQRVVDRIFPREIHNFMKILCRYHKAGEAQEIFKAYQEYYNEKNNILNATLSYVVLPTEEQLTGIKRFLCRQYHVKDVAFQLQEEKDLVGGFTLRVGDQEIDYSLKGRINALQQKLTWR